MGICIAQDFRIVYRKCLTDLLCLHSVDAYLTVCGFNARHFVLATLLRRFGFVHHKRFAVFNVMHVLLIRTT